MSRFYKYEIPKKPFHISVGAVLFNDAFEICLHHFSKKDVPTDLHFLMDNLDETYHLMRESLEDNESLHQAVFRGIKEEFGAKGNIEKYLGSKTDNIMQPDGTSFEKLTIYHAVKLSELGERTDTEVEGKTKLEWVTPQAALEIYDNQVKSTTRPELDERIIINRFKEMYGV